MENVTKFLQTSSDFIGSGYGHGVGCWFGYAIGFGNGYGYDGEIEYGYGRGYGCCADFVWGSGGGTGSGLGLATGHGDYGGTGNGYGMSYHYKNVKAVNGYILYSIDGMPTGIYRARGNIAQGFILDIFSQKPCYIVKDGDIFAHGQTLKGAEHALREKVMESMRGDKAIVKFVEHFKPRTLYKNSEFFEWHHYLTGSCRMGRENFCENNGVDLNAESTPEYFIALTEHSFGGGTIAILKKYYQQQ